MGIPVCLHDGGPGSTSDGVAELGGEGRIDQAQVRHGRRGQVPLQSRQKSAGPDCSTDCAADRAANAAHDEQQREHGGNVLVINGRKHRQLHAENEDASSDGEENLAHNDVPDVSARLTEVNHQTQAEDVERNAHPKDPLETTGPADEPTGEEQEDKGDHTERVGDISRRGDVQLVHDLQERRKIAGIAVVGNLICHIQQTCTQHGPVNEEFIVQERHGRHEHFVEAKSDD